MPKNVVLEHWFRGSLVLRALAGPRPIGWRHVKSVDEVFRGNFGSRERPDFIWDVFDAPTDLRHQWSADGDVTWTWEPARAIIEVKTLETDWRDRMASFVPKESVPTELDYLVRRLRRAFVKADRQIGAARGRVAGSESLGVLAFVNERFHSLRRPAALAALDILRRRYMPNTNVIVYFHDRCTAEQNHQQHSDGSHLQIHRVSALGDPSHRPSRVFLKELKQVLQMAFRSENFPPCGVRGLVQFDPEGTWGDLDAAEGGWTPDEMRPRRPASAPASPVAPV